MASVRENAIRRSVLQGVEAATEYVLLVVWGPGVLLGSYAALGPRGHQGFYLTLVWTINETRPFLLCGALLYLAALALQRAGSPLLLIRIVGGITAPALALFAGLRSTYLLWRLQPYPFVVPLTFVATFILTAFAYGILFLPRLFKPGATPRLHVHWAVVAFVIILLVPFGPSLLFHALNPAVPIFTSGKLAPRLSGEVVFARWTPGTAPLKVEPFAMHVPYQNSALIPPPNAPGGGPLNLTEEEVQRLHSAGITGHVQVVGGSALTDTGRLVVIMSQQLEAPFEFFAPVEGSNVLYLQTSAGWQKFPPTTGDSKSLVRMDVPEGKPNVTRFEFDSGDGPPWHQEPYYSW